MKLSRRGFLGLVLVALARVILPPLRLPAPVQAARAECQQGIFPFDLGATLTERPPIIYTHKIFMPLVTGGQQ